MVSSAQQNAPSGSDTIVGESVPSVRCRVEISELVLMMTQYLKIKEWKPEDAEKMRQEYLAGRNSGKNVIVF